MTDNSRIKFSREMGFTREEFFRILPAALNDRPFRNDARGVIVEDGTGRVNIDVGTQQFRKIASISLPYIVVDFTFEDFKDEDFEEFMRYFDLRYQRGGG